MLSLKGIVNSQGNVDICVNDHTNVTFFKWLMYVSF